VKPTQVRDGGRLRMAIFGVLCLVAACSGPRDGADANGVLLRVGQQVLTVQDFQTALAMGRIAYAGPDLESPTLDNQLRVRLLNELVEEALILEKARILGIEVTSEEVLAAEQHIRQDYPEGEFEAALLENAVDPAQWRQRLKVRLILEKTVMQVLGPRVTVTSEEPAALSGTPPDDGSDEGRPPLEGLRRTKIEEAYPQWIHDLKQEFPVKINQAEWERLAIGSSARPRRFSGAPGQDEPAAMPRDAKDGNG
jgi:hypothetical protein